MQIGIFAPTAERAVPAHEVALAAEQRGFDSLWVPEHPHTPVDRRLGLPPSLAASEEAPQLHDPFVLLAAAAAVTRSIRLATGVCIVVDHDPIVLAKQVASLDVLSRGRFLFGIGTGWTREDTDAPGADSSTRWRVLRECVEAMREIWQHDAADYHGSLVDFDPIWSWPKPTQRKGPPVLLGSASAVSRQRVVDYCDGWLPVGVDLAELASGIEDLHMRAVAAERDPHALEISLLWPRPNLDHLKRVRDLGVHRAVLAVSADETRDQLLERLDRYRDLAIDLG